MIAALWTFTDLTFILFPILIIWRLQMALKQRIGLFILMSVSLITMVLSILKTVGLQHIADQQADPTATDVQYNATLEILWTCLEQAFFIIMGCVPPLRSIVRLDLTKSIVGSLSSILRRRRSNKSSEGSSEYGISGVPYDDLEMSRDTPGQGTRIIRPAFKAAVTYEGRESGSQQNLVKSDGIHAITETNISYSRV